MCIRDRHYMMQFFSALLFAFLCAAEEVFIANHVTTKEMVTEIKRKAKTWTPLDPEKNHFRNYTDEQLSRALGMPGIDYEKVKKEREDMKKFALTLETGSFDVLTIPMSVNRVVRTAVTLPPAYNWVTDSGYGGCLPPIWDQGSCGSCYAFASVAVFSIRYCMAVAKKNSITGDANMPMIEHSPQDLTSCNIHTLQCNGGMGDYSFKFMEEYGITTLECQPYIDGSNTGPAASACVPDACGATGTGTFTKHYCKKGSTTKICDRERIKYELYKWGPVLTTMEVFEDFSHYGSGIYQYTDSASRGGHAVVLLGWGNENNTDYWYARNSWGSDWGEGGYFKIAMDDRSKLGEDAFFCIPEV
eukprot:TRINITY_DN2342_c0_g1_i5.p1 TRINITY_DN2342_c0_g1~~TRINITY_DN2342_c0_g1_i5.p1  ORF type:complete len:359 (-),score=63.74 TRINITY_DN2342_c0_g1_i5:168-1244(-)